MVGYAGCYGHPELMAEAHWHIIVAMKDQGTHRIASRLFEVVSTHREPPEKVDTHQIVAGPCFCDDNHMGQGG